MEEKEIDRTPFSVPGQITSRLLKKFGPDAPEWGGDAGRDETGSNDPNGARLQGRK